jgi:Ribonuclease G/E
MTTKELLKTSPRQRTTHSFPLQRLGKHCSHSNGKGVFMTTEKSTVRLGILSNRYTKSYLKRITRDCWRWESRRQNTTEDRRKSQKWSLYFMWCSYSNLKSVIIVRSYEVLLLDQDCVTTNCSSAWWIPNKSSHLIRNPLITCHVTRTRDNIIHR